jgi:hypothetical protein
MLATILIYLSAAVAILALLDLFLSEAQKKITIKRGRSGVERS